ncbi:unnamed protein product [Allacma fusca]|uniref:CRAL-TRIO domain-containing protein n=1 Tax=Allacma fusca TaxID=39272 RepID=A0A8J2PNW8_9HEXA|nr:unnamed protein product [Allacma fusca]
MYKQTVLTTFFLLGYNIYSNFAIQTKASRAIRIDVSESNSSSFTLSEELCVKVHSYMRESRAFQNFTLQDTYSWMANLSKETFPELESSFPYLLSGYDFEERPVWVILGKYNLRKIIEEGDGAVENFKKYIYQGGIRVAKSLLKNNRQGQEVRKASFLIDLSGLEIAQVKHVATVSFVLNLLETYSDIISELVGQLVFINVNYVSRMALSLVLPVLGDLFERIRVYGSINAHWIFKLRRVLPLESIPPWYGGSDDFKPIEI